MKKVILLMLLACLFVGCKGEVGNGEGEIQNDPYAKLKIDHVYYDEIEKLTVLNIRFKSLTSNDYKEFDLGEICVNYGQTVIINLPEIPNGYYPESLSYFVVFYDPSIMVQNPRVLQIPLEKFCYVDATGNYKYKECQKVLVPRNNGYTFEEE